MSGHSKWAGIKHKKAATDAKRGKLFSRIIRELTLIAKQGGGDPGKNPKLRAIIDKAHMANMPKDNIQKAIMRGTGELPGVNYDDFSYEGYGPGGVAIIAEGSTDNKNRAASEIRRIFSTYNGNMGESGCVSWMFKQRGCITVPKKEISEEELMELVIGAGAEDLRSDDEENYEIITTPKDFEQVKKVLDEKSLAVLQSEVTMVPQTYVHLEGKQAEQMLNLMSALDEHEDVQNVYANFDIDSVVVESIMNKGE